MKVTAALKSYWRAVTFFALLIVAWEVFMEVSKISRALMAGPLDIYGDFLRESGLLFSHAWYTLYGTVVAFALSAAIGILLALAIYEFKILQETVYPLLVALNAMPKVALAPLFIIWVGFGVESAVLIGFTIAVFPVVLNTLTGLVEIDPELARLARHLSSSEWDVFRKIRFPNSYPYIFAGLKLGILLSLIGVVVGELVAVNQGLGYVIYTGLQYVNTPSIFASLILLVVMSLVMYAAVGFAEKKAIPWHIE